MYSATEKSSNSIQKLLTFFRFPSIYNIAHNKNQKGVFGLTENEKQYVDTVSGLFSAKLMIEDNEATGNDGNMENTPNGNIGKPDNRLRFTPSTLFTNVHNLWRASTLHKSNQFGCVELEGIYTTNSPKEYNGYYYDLMEDAEFQDARKMTVLVPSELRSRLTPGKKYILSGVMDTAENGQRGTTLSWKAILRVSGIVGEIAAEISQTEIERRQKREALLAKKHDRAYRDVARFISEGIFNKTPIRVHVIYGETGIVDGDVTASIGNVRSLHGIVVTESRVNMMRDAEIAEAVISTGKRNDVDIIALMRGGGSNLDVFDSPVIAESVLSVDKMVVCGIGHAVDHPFVESVVDRVFTTPTDFGNFFTQVTERAVEEREGSKARLIEEVKKPYEERVAVLSKEKDTLESKLSLMEAKVNEKTTESDNLRKAMSEEIAVLKKQFEEQSRTTIENTEKKLELESEKLLLANQEKKILEEQLASNSSVVERNAARQELAELKSRYSMVLRVAVTFDLIAIAIAVGTIVYFFMR